MAEARRRKVGEKVQPQRVVCRQCGRVPWAGEQPVTDNGRQLLADFADSSCPLGGTPAGCPSTTEAQEAERENQPQTPIARLRAIRDGLVDPIKTHREDIKTLRQQGTALEARVATPEQDNITLKGRLAALERHPTP